MYDVHVHKKRPRWPVQMVLFNADNKVGLCREGATLYAVTTAAASCVAESEAFLQVAEFTIKEACSRVPHSNSQPWPSQ